MAEIDISMTLEKLQQKVDSSAYLSRPLSEWRSVLADECQVYACDRGYLAKRFDEIHYEVCNEREAVAIVKDNLYALLRFKYFKEPTEDNDERISRIVYMFTQNIRTTLKKVSFASNTYNTHIEELPDYCCAFRNGVWNFRDNKWLFEYQIVDIPQLSTKMYIYDFRYAIKWYIDIDFQPMPFSIMNTSLSDVIMLMREFCKTGHNYCFELMSNMSHDYNNIFSIDIFKHLCQLMGYNILRSFSEHFCFIVGSGGNGKNSLFDGCFVNWTVPKPVAISLYDIEDDPFVTGSLANAAQCIYFESSTNDKNYEESRTIKQLTGSMNQMIHSKGVQKYNGPINCKYTFAANDQEKLKFNDTTAGFRRRINILEIWYSWDERGDYLKSNPDYYDTKFSDSLVEITKDVSNAIMFVYFAMYGIKEATNNFTKNFSFTYNDWRLKYTDVDIDLKERIDNLTIKDITKYMSSNPITLKECEVLFFDLTRTRLYESDDLQYLGYKTYQDMIKMFNDDEASSMYFAQNDVYVNLKILRSILGVIQTQTSFTQSIKKAYGIKRLQQQCYNNQPYAKCRFINGKLRILAT